MELKVGNYDVDDEGYYCTMVRMGLWFNGV